MQSSKTGDWTTLILSGAAAAVIGWGLAALGWALFWDRALDGAWLYADTGVLGMNVLALLSLLTVVVVSIGVTSVICVTCYALRKLDISEARQKRLDELDRELALHNTNPQIADYRASSARR